MKGDNTSATMTEGRVTTPGHRQNHDVLGAPFSTEVSEAFQGSEGQGGLAARVSLGMRVVPKRGRRALGFHFLVGERERRSLIPI